MPAVNLVPPRHLTWLPRYPVYHPRSTARARQVGGSFRATCNGGPPSVREPRCDLPPRRPEIYTQLRSPPLARVHGATRGGVDASVTTMTTAVHNVDQRTPVVSIEHAALPCVVECEQYGPGHAKFVADTSSVIWACGKLLPQHLCEHPDEVSTCRIGTQ